MRKLFLLFVFALVIVITGKNDAQSLPTSFTSNHSAGLNSDGTVYTWGYNTYGQLGNNNTIQQNSPVEVLKGAYSGTTYLGDNSGNKITALALGGFHSLALAEDGTVYAWGYSGSGQLGYNSTSDSHTPVRVLKGQYSGTTYLGDSPSNPIIAIAAGYDCSYALAEDGTVYAWGSNGSGKLGDNTTNQRNTPIKILKGAYSGTTYLGDNGSNPIIAIAAGSLHAIALAQDGTVYTWGFNFDGELGNNSTTDSHIPIKVLKGTYSGTTYLGDNSGNKIIAITAGDYHSVALAEDGLLYSWGFNSNGQLGNNSTTDSHIPTKVLKGDYSGTTYLGDNVSNKVASVAGAVSASYALMQDGTVFSWGANGDKQLGDNSTTEQHTPIQVLKGNLFRHNISWR